MLNILCVTTIGVDCCTGENVKILNICVTLLMTVSITLAHVGQTSLVGIVSLLTQCNYYKSIF